MADTLTALLSRAESAVCAGLHDQALATVCQAYAAGSPTEELGTILWRCLDALLEPPRPDRVRAVVQRLRPVLPPEALCDLLITLGSRIGNRLKDYAADLELQQEALRIAERHGKPLDVLRALSAVVFCLLELQRFAEAEAACQRGLRLAEEAESVAYLAAFVEHQGKVLLKSGRNTEALRFLHEARSDALANGLLAVGAKLSALLAEIYADGGDAEEAGRMGDEALGAARRFGRRLEAELLTRISAVLTRLEDWPRLDALLTRALELDDLLPVQDQANNRHNLATARSNRGDAHGALRLEQEALARYESIGYAMGVDIARFHVAAYQRALGTHSRQDLFQANPLEAAALRAELPPEREAEIDDAWLRHLKQQGLIDDTATKKPAAQVELTPAKPQADDAYLDSLLGFCAQFGCKYADLLAMESGIAAFVPNDAALRQAARLLEQRHQAQRFASVQQALQALWVLGAVHDRLGDSERAHATLEQAVSLAQHHQAAWPELAARRQRAKLFLGQRQFKAALAEHERIGRLLLAARRETAWEARGRRLFLDANFGFVEEMVEACYQAGAAEAAVILLERYRSQSFLDSLAAQGATQRPATDGARGAAQEEIRQLQEQLLALQDRLINSRLTQTAEIDRWRREIAELRQRRDLLVLNAAGAPARAAAAAKPLGRSDLRGLLTQLQIVLAYFVGQEATYVLVASAEASCIVKRDLPRGELERLIDQCRQGWEGSGRQRDITVQPKPGVAPAGAGQAATQLAKLLLDGISNNIPADANVMIVPHDTLCLVPFDALPAPGTSDLLAQRWNISYTPALTSLLRGKSGTRGRGSCIAGVAAFPTHSQTALRFDDLPSVRPEVEAIARLFKCAPLLDAACTAGELRARLPGARFVHLATHGYADPEDPLLSSLVMGDGTFFKAAEVAGMSLAADCVALSACKTALGVMSRGEGILGLAQSFLLAGARTLLASLWCVNDRSTALLFGRFYQGLARGQTRAEALRHAKDFVRNYTEDAPGGPPRRPFADPFYWAPFVLLGYPGGLSSSGATP